MAENIKGPVAVIGAGGWGTALASHLGRKGIQVFLWAREPEVVETITAKRENIQFLPGVNIPSSVTPTSDLGQALASSERYVVMAVPTHGMRGVLQNLRQLGATKHVVISVAKGFEVDTLMRPSQVIQQALDMPPESICVLSGPSHAEEVGREVPTAVVAASANVSLAAEIQQLFFSGRFRVYSHSDLAGVEYGGALKNVIAVACGVGDGLGFGDNTRAALVTRGLAEMTRLGCALGAKRETFWGLAGLGDLLVTCTSDLSRNRKVGRRIGAGERLDDILAGMVQVAEGIRACRAAVNLAASAGVVMPITQQLHAILFENRSPSQAMDELLSRNMRSEEER